MRMTIVIYCLSLSAEMVPQTLVRMLNMVISSLLVVVGISIRREFFKAKDWVQQLKLRASYGLVGNRPTELYSQYTLYAMSTGYNGDPGAVNCSKRK